MAKSDHEFQFLKTLLRILQTESTPEKVITELYPVLFGPGHPPRVFKQPHFQDWETSLLARAIPLFAQIAARYVAFFAEPRNLPVTHYWRQKQVALALDAFFAGALWESIRRSQDKIQDGYKIYDERMSSRVKDDFLDTPILFLKQEARQKKSKSLESSQGIKQAEARFLEKALSSGIDLNFLEQQDFHSL